MLKRFLLIIALAGATSLFAEADTASYVPLSKAITAKIQPAKARAEGLTGYLGVSASKDTAGRVVIDEVAPGSPAKEAGIEKGDTLLTINGKRADSEETLRSLLQSLTPGDAITVELKRGNQTLSVKPTLGATSRPFKTTVRAIIGVRMGTPLDAGVPITSVTKGMPAAQAGLQPGDIIRSVDGTDLGEDRSITDALSEKKVGDKVLLRIRHKKLELEKTLTLVAAPESDSIPLEERRELKTWKKPVFNIAVIPIEFADDKHSEKIALTNWDEAFFSTGVYNTTNALKQTVYGSMNDYYQEVSCGKLSIKGKVFPWITTSQKHAVYSQLKARGSSKDGLLAEAIKLLLARDGEHALDGFDGLGFIYAGEKGKDVSRGSIFWPHRSAVRYEGKSWSYVIIPELRDGNMTNISVMCHETGHSLGLPDLYARPENPGSEGAGRWCVMSNQTANGRPQHFSAWSKEQLGWIDPVVIDPTVKQKLVLSPIQGSTTECLKVLVRRDGSEYFLLENRRQKGFDKSLPAEGLLIWRVVGNRPILEESHGITGPSGPRLYLTSVPYPSRANNAFTPYTTPSSRSQLGGGLPVNISNIRQLPDGRITLDVGYEFQ